MSARDWFKTVEPVLVGLGIGVVGTFAGLVFAAVMMWSAHQLGWRP